MSYDASSDTAFSNRNTGKQLSLFDTEETIQDRADDEKALEKERALQEAMLTIKHKFGKNAVLKGTNFT